MSARADLKPLSWHPLNPAQVETKAKLTTDMELETLLRNHDPLGNVSPPPDPQSKPARKPNSKATREAKDRTTGRLPEPGQRRAVQRELLLSEIKRGEECLDQIRKDLAAVRADLEEWPAYERICGRNPLADYLQSISAKQQIAKFLPGWLKRQRQQLQNLDRKRESAAAM